ncbi:MAG TPA: GNAT family N-acetyltransferase, partial [Armatimonadota bacterium]|nr:GNAT family N-acetyltransferase [Armatimonadota bacterium]
IRPSGPHDPDLPVLALRRATGELAGALFCHATHNIGALRGGVRSPGFFGLAARELERRHGGTFLYAPGAFGSSHRPDGVSPQEAMTRVAGAVEAALARLRPALVGPVAAIKRPFTCTRRAWDEAQEDASVRRWCDRWYDGETAETYAETFAAMRAAMAALAGQPLETWLQVIRLGEVAIVGIPGEMFGALGLEIRRRSPFRDTIVVGLANDEIGYIPDRQGYADGGYQTWVGHHCQIEPGTGERMVEAVLAMLDEVHSGPPGEVAMDVLRAGDELALQRFYNELSARARWFFRPFGWTGTYAECADICARAAAGSRIDHVLRSGDSIVGWASLEGWDKEVPHLGIGVADEHCGKGHGKQLMQRLIDDAREAGKRGIELIHVKENATAGGLYRSLGFKETGERVGLDGNDYWEMRLDL